MALYHQAKNETEEAETFFKLAFESGEYPVDLLELHYGRLSDKPGRN